MRVTIARHGNDPVNAQSILAPAASDDTIEVQLTEEQLLELSQAAEATEPFAAVPLSAVAAADRPAPAFCAPRPFLKVGHASHSRRWHQTPLARIAGATVAYAVFLAFAFWGTSQFAKPPRPAAVALARPIVIPRPAVTASSPPPTVTRINPFDPTEVFEFPAGTGRTESREKMAHILLQRARERRSEWERAKPAETVRTASLARPP